MKALLFALLLMVSCLHCSAQEKIKMYIFYTPSHVEMLEKFFLPSLTAHDDYEIISEVYEQQCESGEFMKAGWIETMHHKVDLVIRAIKENWGKVFVHADVDIQFFGPTQEIICKAMEGKDLVIQQDDPYGLMCAGFFACRGNEKTLKLWQTIKRVMNEEIHDQDVLNVLVRKRNDQFNIVWDYLPRTQFCGGGSFTGKHWEPGLALQVPEDLRMHHANYTYGIENKLKELEYVYDVMRGYKSKKSLNLVDEIVAA